MADLAEEPNPVSGSRIQAPDLGTQFEDLLTYVFDCEAWQRVEDRIDLAVRILRPSRPNL